MTENEKQENLKILNEDQLRLMQVMSEGDAHAIKCMKMGLNYEEQYPEEYARYIIAREQYNVNEVEINRLELIQTDDIHAE